MSYDKRHRLAYAFRGAAFALLQSLKGRRPSKVVYNLTYLNDAKRLTTQHMAYLCRAVDVPHWSRNRFPPSCNALRGIGSAITAQPDVWEQALQKHAQHLVGKAVRWLSHRDEEFRFAAGTFLAAALPLIDRPLPADLIQKLNGWVAGFAPNDPRRDLQPILQRLNPAALPNIA